MQTQRSRIGLLAALVLSTAAMTSGCGKSDQRAKSPDEGEKALVEDVRFRLAWVYDMAEVGVLVAKEHGHFEKEGLNVTIEPGGFGLDPIKLVATGSADYGIGGAGNLLLARAQGVPVVAVAAEFQNTPVGFITRKDSGIKSFPEFAGKRVGVQTGADTDVLYRALLAKHGMSSKDVKEVPIQFDMGPFVNGLIDVLPAYVTNQPITLQSKGFETTVITAASEGLRYYGNVFFTTEQKLNKDPQQVERFVRAVRAGWADALADKAGAIAALAKYTNEFNADDLGLVYDAVVPFIKPDEPNVPLLGMTHARWENTTEALLSAGLLKQAPELSAAFTLRFAQ
ncbi:MAG: ABC transporter substrate-binding protein [Panacagrimonas sp.]